MWCRENVCCVSSIIKWIYACIIHYNVMFTCTLLRSHPESKKTLGETWATVIKAINSILWTSVTSRCLLTRMGAGPCSVCGQKGTMKDVFARCLKRVNVQVCTLTSVYSIYFSVTVNIHALATYIPFFLRSTIVVFLMYKFLWLYYNRCIFSQVKNKPWIPWVYTWFWHCREQITLPKTKVKQNSK
jgi:hypothetical protein